MVQGGMLEMCVTPRPKLRFREMTVTKAMPNDIGLLGQTSSSDPGAFAEELRVAPNDWLCSGSTIQEMCPFKSIVDMNEGFRSCSEGLSKLEFFKVLNQQSLSSTGCSCGS